MNIELKMRYCCCFAMIAIFVLSLFSLSGCTEKRTPPMSPKCDYKLKQIGCALHAYYDRNGHFPPAVTYDANGRKMASWRVLILPYMDEGRLYQEYDLNQPWDSPNNLKLLDKIPEVYQCQEIRKTTKGTTPFVAIVGDETSWRKRGTLRFQDFQDGLQNTILVMESQEDAVPWTKPIDYEYSEAEPEFIRSTIENHSSILFADGSVLELERTINKDQLQAAFTRSAGDTFDRDLLFHIKSPELD